jgi:Flp pilus assembly CpaF family ATPase
MRLLDNGSRIAASIPPLAESTQATIRVYRPRTYRLDDLAGKSFPTDALPFLRTLMASQRNVVVSGATASGKTTFVRALAQEILDRRVVVIEDTRELKLPIQWGVSLECATHIDRTVQWSELLVYCMRQAPDHVLIGEIRHADALTAYLESLEAGFTGGVTTMHATSAEHVLSRMASILSRKGSFSDPAAYRHLVRKDLHAICHCRSRDGRYRVEEIVAIYEGELLTLWLYDPATDTYHHDPEALAALSESEKVC